MSHDSLRQTGVAMLKSRFKVLVQTSAVLGPAQPRKAGRHARGLQACRHLTVIALVLYRTPGCAQGTESPCNRRSGREFRFLQQGNTSVFSLSKRLSAEHPVSKCSIDLRFQIYILI